MHKKRFHELFSEACEQCIVKENCPSFSSMNTQDQVAWTHKFPCDDQQGKENNIFGFSAVAKGELVRIFIILL